MTTWKQWFKFHDYLRLTHKHHIPEKEAVEQSKTWRGFIWWLIHIRPTIKVNLEIRGYWPVDKP